jgi:hypothetical protein
MAVEITFLRHIERKIRKENKKQEEIKEPCLRNNRRKWYGHMLRMNKDRIPMKVLNMKLKTYLRGRLRSSWEQQVRKDVMQTEEN